MTAFDARATLRLRPPRSVTAIETPVQGVTIHHVGGNALNLDDQPHERSQEAWRRIQADHMDNRVPKFADVAYTMAASHHDVLLAGRGAGVRTAANGTTSSNAEWYAICALMGEGDPLTAGMIRALRTGIATLRAAQVPAGPLVNRHGDHKATACPGSLLSSWVRAGCPPPADDGQELGVCLVWADRDPGEQEHGDERVAAMILAHRHGFAEATLEPDGRLVARTNRGIVVNPRIGYAVAVGGGARAVKDTGLAGEVRIAAGGSAGETAAVMLPLIVGPDADRVRPWPFLPAA